MSREYINKLVDKKLKEVKTEYCRVCGMVHPISIGCNTKLLYTRKGKYNAGKKK